MGLQLTFKKEYDKSCQTKSDINEHLPVLYVYAKECNHITEMGVRDGQSTRAFLYANPEKLICYDLYIDEIVNSLFDKSKSFGKDYHYIKADTRKISIEPTDLLFIDTLHKYEQLKVELILHAKNVRKYIVFHDTETFGTHGQKPDVDFGYEGKGIWYAIEEFLQENKEWDIVYKTSVNNGLTILERK